MAYTPKSTIQSFQSSWQKTLSWAESSGLPRTSWYPVYQLDAQRLRNGYGPMPMADRLNAILASGNPNNVTPLPTDQPKPTSGGNLFTDLGHLASNAVHDVTNIFTGLNPIHLGPALWDMVQNTIHHPGQLFDPTKDTLAQLIPGVSVIGQIEQHGFSSLGGDPVSTLLDVLPIFDGVTSLVGHAGSLGDMAARTAGYTSGEQMAKAGTIRTAISAVGNIPIGRAASDLRRDPLTGAPIAVRETIGSRVNKALNAKLFGPEQAAFAETMSRISAGASVKLDVRTAALAELTKSVKPADVLEARNVLTLTTKYKDYSDIYADPSVSLGAKEVLRAAQPVLDWEQEKGLAAGDIVKIRMPDGTTEIFPNNFSNPVIRARNAFDAAQKDLESASAAPDALRAEITHNDSISAPLFARLDTYSQRIRNAFATDTAAAQSQLLGFPVVPADQAALHATLSPPGVLRHSSGDIPLALPGKAPSATVSRLLDNVFTDGGLVDQAKTALLSDDFTTFRNVSREIHRILTTKTLSKFHSPLLDEVRNLTAQLHDYAATRLKKETEFNRLMEDPKKGVNRATKKLHEAGIAFEKAVHDNPSAVWIPLYVQTYIKKLLEHEDGIRLMDQALHDMGKNDIPHETIEQARANPQALMDLLTVFLKSSTSSPFMDAIPEGFQLEARNSALNEIAHLRATGNAPHYVPKISTRKLGEDPFRGSTHVSLPLYKPNVSMAKESMVDTSDSVYDIVASTSYAAKEIIRRDAAAELIDEHIIGKLTYSRSDLLNMIWKDPTLVKQLQFAETMYGSQEAAINDILSRHFQLTTFDPYSFGNVRTTKATTGETLYIDKDVLRGIENTLSEGQLPQRGIVAAGTKVFRTAILAFSPRYTAHILLGGTFLMGIREPLSPLFMTRAWKMTHDPETMAQIATTSTQRGAADMDFLASAAFLEAGGRQMAHSVLGEYVSKGMSKVAAVANLNFKFTNWVTNMQRAMVYAEAGWKSGRKIGRQVLDPETGLKTTMTAARAQEEAMRSVDKVMGNLTRMSPLERNVFTKLMPFYGWTKHILTYVASYPLDHPYKALVLSHLANINSADVPLGLPLRIQNLFFLGKPDPYGNVDAIDVRALNPLRDTGNYFSLSGWLSSLNPAITSVLSYINPQMTFGGNVLYPNITYDRLYGINEAGPQGSFLTAAEQYVPQIGALDAALQLSSQYKDLKVTNPGLFAKTVFEALNIPFAQVQHVNLRQLAAKNEMDRFNQAKNVAKAYFQSPTPQNTSTLAGYQTLPNPLNPLYQLTPAELAAVAQNAMSQTGLPASEVIPQVENPTTL